MIGFSDNLKIINKDGENCCILAFLCYFGELLRKNKEIDRS